MAEVVVVGSCMTDLISYVPRLPRSGETIHGHRFSKGFGGKGANQCIMAARLGARSAMVARVGEDAFGRDTVKNFKDNGVNVDHVILTPNVSSGVAPISVNDKGENSIVIIGGANGCLATDDVMNASSLVTAAKVVVCQLEVPLATTTAALKMARQHGVTTLFNPAPGVTELPEEVYNNTDILCLNETEVETLTGVLVVGVAKGVEVVRMLLSEGIPYVVLTLGAMGVVFNDDITDDITGDITIHHVPAMTVDVVDTTGAGDAFVGALSYFLSRHPSLTFKEKVERSVKIASYTVTAPGTQTSYNVNIIPPELL